jgi:hypothetical protein
LFSLILNLTAKGDLELALRAFMKDHALDVLVLMTAFHRKEQFMRELAFLGNSVSFTRGV